MGYNHGSSRVIGKCTVHCSLGNIRGSIALRVHRPFGGWIRPWHLSFPARCSVPFGTGNRWPKMCTRESGAAVQCIHTPKRTLHTPLQKHAMNVKSCLCIGQQKTYGTRASIPLLQQYMVHILFPSGPVRLKKYICSINFRAVTGIFHDSRFYTICEAFPVVVYAGKAWTQVLTGY